MNETCLRIAIGIATCLGYLVAIMNEIAKAVVVAALGASICVEMYYGYCAVLWLLGR